MKNMTLRLVLFALASLGVGNASIFASIQSLDEYLHPLPGRAPVAVKLKYPVNRDGWSLPFDLFGGIVEGPGYHLDFGFREVFSFGGHMDYCQLNTPKPVSISNEETLTLTLLNSENVSLEKSDAEIIENLNQSKYVTLNFSLSNRRLRNHPIIVSCFERKTVFSYKTRLRKVLDIRLQFLGK